ncbi:MAG: type IV toxin-antitoxin system AbiEi family antitoxin domain-containing protein [Umezawaea sp.]
MDVKRAMNVLAGFTADQWGLVTTAQAVNAGVDSVTLARLVDAGLIDHIRRGVYASASAPQDRRRAARAAWLQLNPRVPAWKRPLLDPDGGVFSHGTAAHVHDLGDLLLGAFQFTVPRRRTSTHPDIEFRHLPLAERDVVKVDGLPVTTVERAIADLLADHIDGGHMGDIIHRAIQRGQVDVVSLAHRVGPYARRYGVTGKNGMTLMHSLLEQAGKTMPDFSRPGYLDAPAQLISKSQSTRPDVDSSPELQRSAADLADAVLSSPRVKNFQEQVRLLLESPAMREALSRTQTDAPHLNEDDPVSND